MIKIKKSKTVILCEGASDLAFISLYLIKKYNFVHKKETTFKVNKEKGEYCANYTNDKHEVIIFAVGGKDNFNNVYTNYIHRFIISGNNNDFLNLVIVIDADEDKYSNINSLKLNGLNLIENERVKNGLMNLYGDEEILGSIK